MCGDCFQYIGRGIRHPCNKRSQLLKKERKLSQVTSMVLKTIICEKQGKIKLSTSGTSLHVQLRVMWRLM